MRGQAAFPFFQRPTGRAARARSLGLVPRVAPAALRVPNPVHAPQLGLAFPPNRPHIFVHEGARQALERRLQGVSAGRPVVLAVTDNCRSMITASRRGGVLRARVHMMFLDADPSVQDALARYVVLSDRKASHVIGRFIDRNGHRIRAARPVLTPLVTKGQHHDLLSLFHDVNAKYFGGAVEALVTWARASSSRRPRATIKLGSYSAVEKLVRVHPKLDRAWVPRYFVEFIIYHEILHHVIPASRGAGRVLLHPAEFREREKQFLHYERAVRWEKAHLARILRT
jgi:hypothetical protein